MSSSHDRSFDDLGDDGISNGNVVDVEKDDIGADDGLDDDSSNDGRVIKGNAIIHGEMEDDDDDDDDDSRDGEEGIDDGDGDGDGDGDDDIGDGDEVIQGDMNWNCPAV